LHDWIEASQEHAVARPAALNKARIFACRLDLFAGNLIGSDLMVRENQVLAEQDQDEDQGSSCANHQGLLESRELLGEDTLIFAGFKLVRERSAARLMAATAPAARR
jgi:hypothetical protein